ncbi:hypothetical protein BDZ94DRAFT_1275401 [Collybia nuda]|uniref:Uncharacterized protein n=1 Tax=Collybia nuda TaxID=64659 RepID=A0A9P6CCY0_9AGAR|nr:hypothetical protein BDZ94DRAFT_1275401 [Collybia nuda]
MLWQIASWLCVIRLALTYALLSKVALTVILILSQFPDLSLTVGVGLCKQRVYAGHIWIKFETGSLWTPRVY